MSKFAGLFFLVGLVFLTASCGNKGTAVVASVDQQAFDKGPPELKLMWNRILEADRTNDYVFAQRMLYGLSRQGLTPEQEQAVKNENGAVSKRMYSAAEKGDAAALKAIEDLRRNPPNR